MFEQREKMLNFRKKLLKNNKLFHKKKLNLNLKPQEYVIVKKNQRSFQAMSKTQVGFATIKLNNKANIFS